VKLFTLAMKCYRHWRNGCDALREGFAIRETATMPCEEVSPFAKRLRWLARRFRHSRNSYDALRGGFAIGGRFPDGL